MSGLLSEVAIRGIAIERFHSRLYQSGEKREDRQRDRAVDGVVSGDVRGGAPDADRPDTERDGRDDQLQRLRYACRELEIENRRQQAEREESPAQDWRVLLRPHQAVDRKIERDDLRGDVLEHPIVVTV